MRSSQALYPDRISRTAKLRPSVRRGKVTGSGAAGTNQASSGPPPPAETRPEAKAAAAEAGRGTAAPAAAAAAARRSPAEPRSRTDRPVTGPLASLLLKLLLLSVTLLQLPASSRPGLGYATALPGGKALLGKWVCTCERGVLAPLGSTRGLIAARIAFLKRVWKRLCPMPTCGGGTCGTQPEAFPFLTRL